MTDDIVARAKAALEGVTGPWEAAGEVHSLDDGITETCWDVDGPHGGWVARCQDDLTAEFVAASRSLVPELVAELERLRAVQAALVPEYARAFTRPRDGARVHGTHYDTRDDAVLSGSTVGDSPVEVRWCGPWGLSDRTETPSKGSGGVATPGEAL